MASWLLPSICALVIWGVWGFFPKLAAQNMTPTSVSIYQAIGSLAVTLVLLFSMKFKLDFNGKGISFAILSGVAGTLGSVFYNIAAKNGKISVVVVVTAMYPIVTILLSVILLNEKVQFKEIAGMVMAVISILIISL